MHQVRTVENPYTNPQRHIFVRITPAIPVEVVDFIAACEAEGCMWIREAHNPSWDFRRALQGCE